MLPVIVFNCIKQKTTCQLPLRVDSASKENSTVSVSNSKGRRFGSLPLQIPRVCVNARVEKIVLCSFWIRACPVFFLIEKNKKKTRSRLQLTGRATNSIDLIRVQVQLRVQPVLTSPSSSLSSLIKFFRVQVRQKYEVFWVRVQADKNT